MSGFLSSIFGGGGNIEPEIPDSGGGGGWSAPLVNGLFNVATSVAGNIFSSKAKKDAAKETEKAALDEQLRNIELERLKYQYGLKGGGGGGRGGGGGGGGGPDPRAMQIQGIQALQEANNSGSQKVGNAILSLASLAQKGYLR